MKNAKKFNLKDNKRHEIFCDNSPLSDNFGDRKSQYISNSRPLCNSKMLVGDDVVGGICNKCVSALQGIPEGIATREELECGFVNGWKTKPIFVHDDGRVFHKGIEQPHLLGTMDPTSLKKDKPVKHKTSKQKKSVADELAELTKINKMKKLERKSKRNHEKIDKRVDVNLSTFSGNNQIPDNNFITSDHPSPKKEKFIMSGEIKKVKSTIRKKSNTKSANANNTTKTKTKNKVKVKTKSTKSKINSKGTNVKPKVESKTKDKKTNGQ